MTALADRRPANTDRRAGGEEYRGMLGRLLRSYGRRAMAGQVDITALEQLREIQAELDEQTAQVVRALRSSEGGSYSWAAIGDALGITRAAAYKRFGSAESDARRPGGQPHHLR